MAGQYRVNLFLIGCKIALGTEISIPAFASVLSTLSVLSFPCMEIRAAWASEYLF